MELVSAVLNLPVRARLLVLATIGSGAAVLAWQLGDLGGWSVSDVAACTALAVAVALSEQLWIPLKHRTETENFSLTDTVFAAGLILVRPSAFLLGVALGAIIGQAARRIAPLKAAFNVGQFMIGLAVASWLYGSLGPDERFGEYTWFVAAAALTAYAIVNFTSVALVIAFAQRIPMREALLPGLSLSILHFIGNVALGMLAALVIVFEPLALPLLAVPIGLSYLTYRGRLRAQQERDRMRDITAAADEIARERDFGQRVPEAQEAEGTALLASTLNRMLDGLEGAMKRERRFIRESSHELRTPITICRGHLEVLGENPSREAARAAIDVVLDELRRMSRIVGDLATLARAEHADFVHRKDIELRPFIEDLALKSKPLLNGRLRMELPPEHSMAHGDDQRLTQAVLNLLHNAERYTPPESPIHTRVVAEPTAWRFEVADRGTGLDASLEEAVFEPFFRAANGRSGSGLGLAVARRVAEAHGGTAGVDNRPGHGATFWITIPR